MDIIIAVFCGIMTIMILILFISCLISMIKGIRQKEIALCPVVIATIITLLLFSICAISVFAYGITQLCGNPLIPVRLTATTTYILAQESMVLSFILRIHTVFKGS
eukprot:457635_1